MLEQNTNTQAKELEIKDLTSALMNALGVKASEEGDKIQSAIIFLSKLYRKYSPQIGKKFNEIKLNRLNGLLYKVSKEQPSQKQDIQLIYQIILSFIYNEGGSPFDQNSFASNTCIWIAKFIEEVLALKQPITAVEAIQTLLKIKKPNLILADEFDKRITESTYFKDKQISKEDETNANKKYVYRGFMSEFSIYEQILNKINPMTLFTNLYNTHQNKSQIIKLFLPFCREVEVKDLKSLFIKVFITDKIQTKQTLSAILTCLDSQFFTGEYLNEIIKLLLSVNQRKLFYSLPIKNLKCQNRYLQILMEDAKPNISDDLAETFINEKETNNYYLIYLINKSNQKLSQRFITLPLEVSNKFVTNRQAIICALSINHNHQVAHNKILKHFFDHEGSLSNKQKLDCLRIGHFSYINTPKSHLLTQIIKSVTVSVLDQESSFQFLPRDNYEKKQLDKNQREELSDFLSRYLGNSDEVFWIKLDLYTACGKMIPYMQDFRKVQKIFQAPIDQIVADLPNIPQNLLQVVLMGVNNKLDEQFIINQNNTNSIIQWGFDIYKKQQKKFKTNVQTELKRNNQQHLLDLCLEIFYFNLDQNTDLEFEQNLKHITSSQVAHKLNGLHFSEYFMGWQMEKSENLQPLLKSKNMLIQLKKLIKALKNDSKTQNRKQLKTLISEEVNELRALKIINLLSSIPAQKQNNLQKLKFITQNLLKNIKADFESFKQLSTKSSNVNITYVRIFESLQFLLRVNYDTTINFLARLLKSREVKLEDRELKKSIRNKRKSDTNKEKNIESITQNIQYCFRGDPNTLKTYTDIITIVEEIKNIINNQVLAQELTKWVSKIKMFHKENYKEWNEKVLNYIYLWQAIAPIISATIGQKEIERHFLMMIEMLNTLYEKHKQEKDVLNIEKKLLNGIYILYIMASNKSNADKMQQQIKIEIPKQKLDEVIANNQLPFLSVPHIYYCFECSRKICHQCAEIIHKQHDKNYIGSGVQTQCHKVTGKNNPLDKKIIKEKYIKHLKQNRDRELLESERDLEKITRLIKDPTMTNEIYMRLKQQKSANAYKRGERGGNSLIIQTELFRDLDFEQDRKKQNQEENTDKLQIKSCSEKQFLVHTPYYISNTEKPKPVFENLARNFSSRISKLNVTPLFNLLARQLKSNSFYLAPQCQSQQKSSSQFQVQMSNEKYTLFRHDLFRYSAPRLGAAYFIGQQQQNSSPIFNKRSTLTFNNKFIAILTGGLSNQIHYLQSKNLQARFLKRESQKKYKDNDMYENYQICQNKADQPSVSQISFSPFTASLMAQISIHKIIFKQVSRDGRVKQLTFEQSVSGEILKFEWMKANDLKMYYSYLANDIVIKKMGRNQIQSTQLRIPFMGKKIKDYCNAPINSKTVVFTALDTEGKLYRSKVDILNKKIPNFIQHVINFQNTDTIIAVNCQGPSIYCTTQSGKIIVLNANDDNHLITVPITYPIIQGLKTHKISDTNLRLKQITKIAKLKYLTKHHNQVILSCILMRENPGDLKKLGFFALISLNIQSKRSKIIFYNDQGTTESYDCLMLNQKQYMLICLQEDGELWACKYSNISKTTSTNSYDFGLVLSLNEVNKYAQEIKNIRLLDKIQFYNEQRRPIFKQHPKITDHYKVNYTQNFVSFEINEKHLRSEYLTGIEFGYNFNAEQDGAIARVVFSFLGNIYKYQISRTRQIQLPLTIKQSLSLFLGLQQLKIHFIEGKPNVNMKDINLFGIKWSERSVYLDSLTNLCKMIYIYKESTDPLKQKKLQTYFLNQYKEQLKTVELEQLEEYFKEKQFTISEQNLFMKLELLRQSIEDTKIDNTQLYEYYEGIKNYLLPNCNDNRELAYSIQKLSHKLTLSAKDHNVLKLGHILNYSTQFDIYNIFKLYKQFIIEPNIDTYQELLASLCKIFNSRTLNAFIILSVHSNIIEQICSFFKKVIQDYRVYFKITQNGMEQDQKLKMNNICNCLMRILIENYQLKKNKNRDGRVNCEENFIKMLENIFCISKKEVHREIKLNPFKYLEPTFEYGKYNVVNPPLNYLQIQQVNIQQPQALISQFSMLQQQKPKLEQNNQSPQQNVQLNQPNPQPQSQSHEDMQLDYQESYEEHKQAEQQNREMEEEYIYEMQAQKMNNIEKIIDEDEEEIESNRNQSKNQEIRKYGEEINIKKIYQYLFELNNNAKNTSISFEYVEVCENLLAEIFSQNSNTLQGHKYLNTDNLVFYVGFVYNILLVIEKTLSRMFRDYKSIDFSHPYISKTIFNIIKVIDSRLDTPAYSVLYLPLNSIIAFNPITQKNGAEKSFFVSCLKQYYSLNIVNSKLLECITSSAWYPSQFKKPASLSSVLRFEFFDLINPIYQLKFVGNIYLNLRNLNLNTLQLNKQLIKNNVLKAVVKYNLRVYQNIMIVENWSTFLEQTKINVAFEQLKDKPQESLRAIIKSLTKDPKNFIQSMNKDPERINNLQTLLGSNSTINELVLEILNVYYNTD